MLPHSSKQYRSKIPPSSKNQKDIKNKNIHSKKFFFQFNKIKIKMKKMGKKIKHLTIVQ
jgi:hypothetical protein